MFGGDFERKIVVVGLFTFVGDDMALNLRIGGVLYNAKPGFVVNDNSPYYFFFRRRRKEE
jgi:hypothetical protein